MRALAQRLKLVSLGLTAACVLAGPVLGQAPPEVVKADITGTPFQKYLTYQTYSVLLSNGEQHKGGFVFGPGHHVSGMAALVFGPRGAPYATFKTGDTRLSRALRAEPYVAINGIAGRWDKAGYSAGNIVLAELAEEVGGEVVDGTFRPLGGSLLPTMPFESTEADEYFMAVVELTKAPYGDGGQMEVLDLIGPIFLSPQETIWALDEGRISDAARARSMFGRAWDAIGYLPALGLYVQDYPELAARYDTLGLGPVEDLRFRVQGKALPVPREKADTLKARINTVVVDKSTTVSLDPDTEMIDARIQHAVSESGKITPLAPDFASQYLRLDYDRAKIAVYFLDPKQGPMVEMAPQVRPALAFAPKLPNVIRRDLRDVRVAREEVPQSSLAPALLTPEEGGWGDPRRAQGSFESLDGEERVLAQLSRELPGPPRELAFHSAASSGQSDLYYHNVACRIDPPEARTNYVTLAQAIQLCRTGHGDAQTESTLLRLADHLGWIPELGMSKSDALRRLSK